MNVCFGINLTAMYLLDNSDILFLFGAIPELSDFSLKESRI